MELFRFLYGPTRIDDFWKIERARHARIAEIQRLIKEKYAPKETKGTKSKKDQKKKAKPVAQWIDEMSLGAMHPELLCQYCGEIPCHHAECCNRSNHEQKRQGEHGCRYCHCHVPPGLLSGFLHEDLGHGMRRTWRFFVKLEFLASAEVDGSTTGGTSCSDASGTGRVRGQRDQGEQVQFDLEVELYYDEGPSFYEEQVKLKFSGCRMEIKDKGYSFEGTAQFEHGKRCSVTLEQWVKVRHANRSQQSKTSA
eukprot:SRR837773.10447.p2 GENE.SRR837773.10447~~SRR837773.10447.p2  ORF type:complete len:252 (-),score=63.36 SRR837773.10447:31-786(-)